MILSKEVTHGEVWLHCVVDGGDDKAMSHNYGMK